MSLATQPSSQKHSSAACLPLPLSCSDPDSPCVHAGVGTGPETSSANLQSGKQREVLLHVCPKDQVYDSGAQGDAVR